MTPEAKPLTMSAERLEFIRASARDLADLTPGHSAEMALVFTELDAQIAAHRQTDDRLNLALKQLAELRSQLAQARNRIDVLEEDGYIVDEQLAETRGIAVKLVEALMDIPLDALQICTDKTMKRLDAALDKAKAVGISPPEATPTRPEAELPPSE